MRRPALTALRWNRHEIAGGLGDSGLLIPLAIAMVAVNGLNATAVFAGVGLAYIGTALYFGVPVPVQPLKAFAAAAIALGLEADVLAAGALLMAAAMALLAVTGAAGWLAARFPVVLVRGIQASVALLLAKAAVELAERGNWASLPAIDPALAITWLLSRAAFSSPCGAAGGCRAHWWCSRRERWLASPSPACRPGSISARRRWAPRCRTAPPSRPR